MACNAPLESSWQGLQLRFRPHPNQRFVEEVINSQSCGSPNLSSFGTPTWNSHLGLPLGSPRTKRNSNAIPTGRCRVYYMGKVVASPKSGLWWVLWVRGCLWLVLAPMVFQPCANQLVCWFCAGLCEWMKLLVTLRSPILELHHGPLPFKSVESQGVCPDLLTFLLFHMSLQRSLRVRQQLWLSAKIFQGDIIDSHHHIFGGYVMAPSLEIMYHARQAIFCSSLTMIWIW